MVCALEWGFLRYAFLLPSWQLKLFDVSNRGVSELEISTDLTRPSVTIFTDGRRVYHVRRLTEIELDEE
jgi:hypothetical protein